MSVSKNLFAAAAAILSLCAACGAPDDDAPIKTVFDPCEPVVLAPEPGTSNAERQSVSEAIHMWNGLTQSSYTLDDVEGAPVIPIHFDPAGIPFHGFYDPERGE